MLPVMFQNSWMPTVFEDFLNNDWMPRANSTAPAVNVKESEKAYTMELAAPGIKKEYCRVGINDEGNLTIAIENKQEHKHEDKHHHYLRITSDREFYYMMVSENGTDFTTLAKMEYRFLSTETIGGFTGVMLGLFTQCKEQTDGYVDVDWFEYNTK